MTAPELTIFATEKEANKAATAQAFAHLGCGQVTGVKKTPGGGSGFIVVTFAPREIGPDTSCVKCGSEHTSFGGRCLAEVF